jgi:hypothetical protein
MLPDAVPEATAVPLTVTVDVGSLVVGVTVTDVVVLLTDAVNVIVLPDVPVFVNVVAGVSAIVLKEALLEGARVTTIE